VAGQIPAEEISKLKHTDPSFLKTSQTSQQFKITAALG
jgi:hypothetical protein